MCAATKTQCSQINSVLKEDKQMPDLRPCLPSPSCPHQEVGPRDSRPASHNVSGADPACGHTGATPGPQAVLPYIWPCLPPAFCSPRSFQNGPVHASQTFLLSGVNQPANSVGPHPRVRDGATTQSQKHSTELSHPLASISPPPVRQTAPQSTPTMGHRALLCVSIFKHHKCPVLSIPG